ncbi:MAG: hypothetical protein WAT41_01245 [Flavobacteriales bacterium]
MFATLKSACFSILSFASTCAIAQDYTIPVVFHVLWATPEQNISDAQVMDALTGLNTGFNSASTGPVEPPYDTLAANMEICFCLATLDPDGTPTTGIDRIETPLALQGGVPESYLNQWPPERYLNIWVVGQTAFGSFQGSYPPDEAANDLGRDGIMIRYTDLVGPPMDWQGIIYFAGRYLNLKLLWKDPIDGGPCGDDGVADTPTCLPIFDCPSFAPDGCAGTQPVMRRNYMTYSYCGTMFTQGQKNRVDSALNSSTAQRNNLWTPENLGLTGCGPVGIPEDQWIEQGFQLSPIPLSGQWNLSFPVAGAWQVSAHAISGQLVGSWQASGTNVVIDLGNRPSGLYLLRAMDSKGYLYTGKVVRP